VIAQNCRSIYRSRSENLAQCISSHYKAGENIIFHLQVSLPYQNQLVKTNQPRRNYTTLYVSLTPKQTQKLKDMAKKHRKSESETLRKMLDTYLEGIETRGLPFETYRKISPLE